MSEYKSIKGKTVQFLGTDPSETSTEGQIWYNSTAGAFKSVIVSEAWSAGAPLTSGSRSDLVGTGTQTAALAAAGRNNSPGTTIQFSNTDEYNGSGWSAGGNMGTARHNITGTGLQTAALGVGGYIEGSGVQSATEEYDGSSWTAGGALPTAKFAVGLAGIQTAAVAAGGRTPSFTNTTEEYNGTSWTAVNNMNTSRTLKAAMTGIETAAVAFGGDTPPGTANVEEYDGTTWTEVNNLPVANFSGGASGPQTSALFFGGNAPSVTTNAFTYDGTNFSATGSLGTAVQNMGTASNAASNSTGLSFGGYGASTYLNNTEEYNKSVNVITPGAWASGGNMNTARNSFEGVGLQDAALAYGGYGTPNVKNETESYDGTSWSEVNNLNTARSHFGNGEAGTQTAAIIFKGNTSASDTSTNATEEWDGTNWTTTNAVPTVGQRNMGAGTQTSALSFGGIVNPAPPAPRTGATQEYNGSAWTAGGTMNTARNDGGGAGTQTAALAYGGDLPGASNATEAYDGTTWTNVNNMAVSSGYYASIGKTQDNVMAAGNLYSPTANGGVQVYDGTNWSTRASLTTGRYAGAGAGSGGTSALVGGGGTPANTNATEEFTGETSALNLKTLTTS